MSYQIDDTGTSLRFTSEDGFFVLMKHEIKAIKIVRQDMIKIDTGCCFNSIFIYHRSVAYPMTPNASVLIDLLNQWITNFLQGYAPTTNL